MDILVYFYRKPKTENGIITILIAIAKLAGKLSLLVEGIIAHSTDETILFKNT